MLTPAERQLVERLRDFSAAGVREGFLRVRTASDIRELIRIVEELASPDSLRMGGGTGLEGQEEQEDRSC